MKIDIRGAMGIKDLIAVVIGIVLFAALMPVVAGVISEAEVEPGIVATLLSYVPLFLVLGVLLGIIVWAVGPMIREKLGTRQSGFHLSPIRAIRTDQRGAIAISGMIGAIILIVVGIIFFPIVQEQVDSMVTDNYQGNEENASLTGTAKTMAELIPLFYVLALVFLAIGWGLRSAEKL